MVEKVVTCLKYYWKIGNGFVSFHKVSNIKVKNFRWIKRSHKEHKYSTCRCCCCCKLLKRRNRLRNQMKIEILSTSTGSVSPLAFHTTHARLRDEGNCECFFSWSPVAFSLSHFLHQLQLQSEFSSDKFEEEKSRRFCISMNSCNRFYSTV